MAASGALSLSLQTNKRSAHFFMLPVFFRGRHRCNPAIMKKQSKLSRSPSSKSVTFNETTITSNGVHRGSVSDDSATGAVIDEDTATSSDDHSAVTNGHAVSPPQTSCMKALDGFTSASNTGKMPPPRHRNSSGPKSPGYMGRQFSFRKSMSMTSRDRGNDELILFSSPEDLMQRWVEC